MASAPPMVRPGASRAVGQALKRNPFDIAQDLKKIIEQAIAASLLKGKVSSVEVLRPGFINFRLAPAALLPR